MPNLSHDEKQLRKVKFEQSMIKEFNRLKIHDQKEEQRELKTKN